jgi:hypothetical protein
MYINDFIYILIICTVIVRIYDMHLMSHQSCIKQTHIHLSTCSLDVSGVSCYQNAKLVNIRSYYTSLWCLYVYIPGYLHIYIYLYVYLSIYRSIDRSIYLSIFLSIYLSIYRSIDLSIDRSIYLSKYF